MHPKEFKVFTERIYEIYGSIYEELHKIKRENKLLLEEMNKMKHTNSLQQTRGEHYAEENRKLIKLGAEWRIEGDNLMPLSLVAELKYGMLISNARISEKGQIMFSCNKNIFLFADGIMYMVEESVNVFDPKMIKNDLVENSKCVFGFIGESMIVYVRNNLIKFTNRQKVWSISIMHAVQMEVQDNKIYVGTLDPKILVFKDDESGTPKCLNVYSNFKQGIKMFRVSMNNVIISNDYGIWTLNDSQMLCETTHVLGMDVYKDIIYFGNGTSVLKTCKIVKNESHDKMHVNVHDNMVFKETIIFVKVWKEYVIVGCKDKTVFLCNVNENKWMKIIGSDCVVDISTNENKICCVGNNGTLKVWEVL